MPIFPGYVSRGSGFQKIRIYLFPNDYEWMNEWKTLVCRIHPSRVLVKFWIDLLASLYISTIDFFLKIDSQISFLLSQSWAFVLLLEFVCCFKGLSAPVKIKFHNIEKRYLLFKLQFR